MSLKDAFVGMREAEKPTPAAKPPEARPEPVGRGKSSNPEFERLTVYVRKRTKKLAARKWEDENDGDMSDLVEDLLTKYLGA
jgi:hypothetical protein